jgi:hypothetical protein
MGEVKLDAAHAAYVAEPPIMRSTFPNGVSRASKAIEPTITKDIFLLFLSGTKVGFNLII